MNTKEKILTAKIMRAKRSSLKEIADKLNTSVSYSCHLTQKKLFEGENKKVFEIPYNPFDFNSIVCYNKLLK